MWSESGMRKMMPRDRADRIAVAAAVVLMFLYLSTMSHWLLEEDSAHFALALRGFDITENRPHPPGFPVYVMMAWLLEGVLGNEVLALTALSAISGGFCFLAVYLLLKDVMEPEYAVVAAILCAVTPIFWLNSTEALSDMPGLLFLVMVLLMAQKHMRTGDVRWLYASCFIAGIAAGVRIHTLIATLPAIVFSASRRRGKRSEGIAGLLLVMAGLSAWLLPVVAYTGIPEYATASMGQLGYRVGKPDISILGTDVTPLSMLQRLYAFAYYFLMEGYGVNIWDPGILSIGLLLLGFFLMVSYARSWKAGNKKVLLLASVCLYVPSIIILLPAFNSRYMLLLVPMISAVFVSALAGMKRVGKPLFIVLVVLVLAHTSYLVFVSVTVPPPMFQLSSYLETLHDEDSVLIADESVASYLEFYGVGQHLLHPQDASCEVVERLVMEDHRVMSLMPHECSGMISEKVAVFSRDQRVHIKRSMIELYEITVPP